MTTTIEPGRRRWYVVINPDFYDDDDDRGFGWTGEADSQEEAVAEACKACDFANGGSEAWDAIDPTEVDVWEAGPDTDSTVKATLAAYQQALADAEVAPNGDDFNNLGAALSLALEGYSPTITISREGR